ncbi:MAG: sugar transferase [Patescibacteria group bacterium]|jgi:exopolysaccharide biosynthesis polyprenyl glycosylphosphotransferase
MKRTELFFSILLVPLDFCALLLAALAAQRIRFLDVVEGIRPALYSIATERLVLSASIIAVVWILFFSLAGLYSRRITDPFSNEFLKIISACSAGLVLVVFIVFFKRELFSSRFVILVAWFLAIFFVTALRFFVRKMQQLLFRFGYAARRIVIVGKSSTVVELKNQMTMHPESGYRVIAVVSPDEHGLAELQALSKPGVLDEVIYADADSSNEERILFLEFAEERHLNFRYTPDLLQSTIRRPVVNFDIGVPLIEVPATKIEGWGRIFKRVFDFAAGVFGLVLFMPVFALVAVGIFMETGLPVFYASLRVGRRGTFVVYKFRSMYLRDCTGSNYGGAAAQALYDQLVATSGSRGGPVPKVINDPRVTRFGKFIRRYSLDELPQFWNIIKGDMSLIGPRPHLPWEVSRYEKHHRKVLAVKPGLTGLAQVSGRSDLDFEEEVRLDRYYVEQWSPLLDLVIILRTVGAVIRPRRAL